MEIFLNVLNSGFIVPGLSCLRFLGWGYIQEEKEKLGALRPVFSFLQDNQEIIVIKKNLLHCWQKKKKKKIDMTFADTYMDG